MLPGGNCYEHNFKGIVVNKYITEQQSRCTQENVKKGNKDIHADNDTKKGLL